VVFIKKIELTGFKTFPRRTSITLGKGMNVIIGPNGSGKTNLIDAVQFVLGELSARALRAKDFSNLLFFGNGEVPKANHATVSIQFDNSDRQIPIDTDIVSISRYVSEDGTSTYRVNGKRYSRGSLIDILAMAGLTSGTNIIHQGTTMKIADFSPEDRRKNIENIIGIAEYDKKKADAQVELREAETNLKVAMGKYEEVKKRLLELEKERNDLLRHNYIKKELNRLKAVKLSSKIVELQNKIKQLNFEIENKTAELNEIKTKRENLESQRVEKQKEWQNYADKVVDRGSDQLLALQKEIGDLNSEIARYKTSISSAKTSLHSYELMRNSKLDTLKSIKDQDTAAQNELKKLKRAYEQIQNLLNEKNSTRSEIISKITEIKQTASENATKLSNIEDQIEKLDLELGRLEVKIKAEKESCEILTEQIQTLEQRKAIFEGLLNDFSSRLKNVNELKKKEQRRLEEIFQTIDRVKKQKETAEMEIKNADRIVKQARLSVTEFESQKKLAENVLSEEKALKHIEDLAHVGAISGVYGRLNDHIRVRGEYKKAVEAASEGWLQALVVDRIDTVKKCAESLRRAKIGRIKVLPLENVQHVKSVERPKIAGIIGNATSFVDCATKYKPAVNFVLGDTLVATSEDAALEASRMGYRVVTIDGEIYEPGFMLEVGFYREPIDPSEIIPSDITIKRISDTVTSFEKLVEKRISELKRLDEQIIKLENDKTFQADTIKLFEHEASNLIQNVDRIHKDIVELNRRIRSYRHRFEKMQNSVANAESRQREVAQQLHSLRVEATSIRKKLSPETIAQLEGENATLEAEINDLQRKSIDYESKIATLESNIKNIFTPSLETIQGEMLGINRNIQRFQKEAEEATKLLEETTLRLKELESAKEQLSKMLLSKKEESKKFADQIEIINRQIQKVDREFASLNEPINQLRQDVLRYQLELEHCQNELKQLGYDRSVEINPEEISTLESSIDRLEDEFVNLSGKVNMLAADLYEPQKRAYKELSIRINQLEEEKREILNFMDTIEKEKRETFLTALTKVNTKFSEAFNAMTGGKGWLQLQNPEDPFAGGIDIIVTFPGKSPMMITAASGGEKSVVAVCYIFAIQSLSKTSPFYIFDEIDAHLDPINVKRLADLLSKEAQTSQIISISFKEAVAAEAERIYGIYSKNGISYVYSMPQVKVGAQ
jgi:chromosome segregation protein